MTVSLITKGMICQGHIDVHVSQKFVLPLKLRLNNQVFNLNIKSSKNEIFINQPINLECNVNVGKTLMNISNKTLKMHIKKICL